MTSTYTDGKFTLRLKPSLQVEIKCSVFMVSNKIGDRAYERIAFYVFKDDEGVEKIYRHTFPPNTLHWKDIAKQKKMLTRVFHACIVPRIIHDTARDLYFRFHFPKKNIRDSLDEYARVHKIMETENRKLKERLGL